MMDSNSSRAPHKVAIADHIWTAFEKMAGSLGSDRDGLINQAMFMFARLNGFLEATSAATSGESHAPAAAEPQAKISAHRDDRTPEPAPAPLFTPGPSPTKTLVRGKEARSDRPPVAGTLDDDPVRREVAERVLETAAELERLIKNKNDPRSRDGESSVPSEEEYAHEEPSHGGEEEQGSLYLMAEGGQLDKIIKDRFVIGRGKHCDFVINSGKVSREHAVISRDGSEYFIEDLDSSNGTWFNKQRIKRRKVEDGDEYFICNEKIKLVMR